MSGSAISKFVQGNTLYVAVAASGLLASWWVGGGSIEAHRPVQQVAPIEMAGVDADRPNKDDILASLRPIAHKEPVPAAVAKPISLPIPAIVRATPTTKVHAKTPTPVKQPEAASTFESCLPACDTRDPLVASAYGPAPRPQLIMTRDDTAPSEPRTSAEAVLDGGKNFLRNAAQAARGALEAGKSAMLMIVSP